jgi:hypothetical protein
VPTPQRPAKDFFIKERVQGISSNVSNCCRDATSCAIIDELICEESSEGALINKPKFSLSSKVESDPKVAIIGFTGVHEQQLTTHSKMCHQALTII